MANPTWSITVPTTETEVDAYPLMERNSRSYLQTTIAREHTFPGTYAATSGMHKPGYCGIEFVGNTAAIAALSSPPTGARAYNTQTKLPYYFDGTDWVAYDMVTKSTTQTITGNKTFSGDNIFSGANTVSGLMTFATIPVGPNSGPTSNNQFSRKKYVDDEIAAIDASGLQGTHNLVVKNNTLHPEYRVDITADRVILINTSNEVKVFNTVSKTVDVTNAGANGLDTGSEATSTWYYIWLIGKSDGTLASLFSTQSALGSLTLPSGYTYGLLVGAVYNDGSGNFRVFRQYGNKVLYDVLQLNGTYTDTSYSAKSVVTLVPIAIANIGVYNIEVFSTGASYSGMGFISADGSNNDGIVFGYFTGAENSMAQFEVAFVTSGSIYVKRTSAPSVRLYVKGFTIQGNIN